MEIAAILAREVFVIFLMIATGVICKKTGILGEKTAPALSNLLLVVVLPCMILYSFLTERVDELLPTLLVCFVVSVLYHLLSIRLSKWLIPDPGDGSTRYRVERLAAVFSNCGFMGFPLLLAVVGKVGLLYGAVYVGVFNSISWIWGAPLLSGERFPLKKLATTPAIVAFFLGAVLHLLNLRLPYVLDSALGFFSGINTPVSMLVIGVYLSSVNLRDAVRDPRVYRLLGIRNILFPLISLLLLWATRVSEWLPGGKVFAISMMIIVSCSSATTAILMSARYGCDSAHGAKLVSASTIAGIVTIPLVVALAALIL